MSEIKAGRRNCEKVGRDSASEVKAGRKIFMKMGRSSANVVSVSGFMPDFACQLGVTSCAGKWERIREKTGGCA